MKIGIIGGGITGISLAQMLKEEASVTVFEQKADIGGLIHCERVNDILYHKVGGHVFNSKNNAVTEWFWNFFDKEAEFIKAKRFAKVWFQGKQIGYPIEDHLFQLDEETAIKAINELLTLKGAAESDNFETFLKNNFGNTLYDLYFKPYNTKIWNVDLNEVPLDWLEGKLPMPKVNEVIINNVLRKEESSMVHAFFYYPKQGGSQFIIDRLAEDLSIVCDSKIDRIEVDGEALFINNEGPFDKIIYTGDIRKLPDLVQGSVDLPQIDKIKALKSNGTTNLLCRCDKNELSWLYIPDKEYKCHRIIYTGNFSSTNNDDSGRSSCTVEFSNFIDIEEAKEELKKLPGNLEFISYNYEPNSYVIQNADTRSIIETSKSVLRKNNIFLAGRFAEWEYHNMDKCIESAMRVVKEVKIKSNSVIP